MSNETYYGQIASMIVLFLGELLSVVLGYRLFVNGFSFTKLLLASIPMMCAIIAARILAIKADREETIDV